MTAYAHSVLNRPEAEWQPLRSHLDSVADLAGEFASAFGAREWGWCAGLWHDVGKYSQEFQTYLQSQSEPSAETLAGRVDHSTAGAQHAIAALPLIGHLVAYAVAGHHAGLLDGRAAGACQEARLAKPVCSWAHGLAELPPVSGLPLPEFVRRALGDHDAFTTAFFARMIFSCLTDADCLNTERFMKGDETADKTHAYPTLGSLIAPFFRLFDALNRDSKRTPVNGARAEVRDACERAAVQTPGFFSLSVPTGGGKTLSAVAFALRHAEQHGLRRIVYVAPFLSIIEQNAAILRQYLGAEAIIEHHSNLGPEEETRAGRFAAENWDAPVIVTTAVQFYESLFANRTSTCRKLHRLARSIVILDEAQTLPIHLLHPCLRALRELTDHYGASVVLCTATQPEIKWRPEFNIGLRVVPEIMPDPPALYQRLRRVTLDNLGVQTDAELAARLSATPRVLCIVNTTRHARELFSLIGKAEGHFHLSARMCPEHRRETLEMIRKRLDTPNAVCRVVSTQVVEAGVDIDFPVVYRALAGLDSIAQAAGRCNRNGQLPNLGEVFVFQTEHAAANRYFSETANCAAQVMARHADDPLALDAIERYFRLYYWDQKARWDERDILGQFRLDGHPNAILPFDFSFATAAERFRFVDDSAQRAIIVPWGDPGMALCARLRSMPSPTRKELREAQRYTVQVRPPEWRRAVERQDVRPIFDTLGILESAPAFYNPDVGLNLDADGPGAYFD